MSTARSDRRLLVTGGCGYVGSRLTQALLARGHAVTVLDTMWFGNFLPPHPRLTLLLHDMRQIDAVDLSGFDTIFHLANIANDPAVELNPYASWDVNVLATMRLADRAARQGVTADRVRLIWQRLRRDAGAARHGGDGPQSNLRIQQDQDGRGTGDPELRHVAGGDDHQAGDGLRPVAPDAPGSHRQPADHAGARPTGR